MDVGRRGAAAVARFRVNGLLGDRIELDVPDARFVGSVTVLGSDDRVAWTELSTTQIYAQVSIRQLKAVHALTHPGAKLVRAERPSLAKTDGTATAEELFSRLAAEDDEEAAAVR